MERFTIERHRRKHRVHKTVNQGPNLSAYMCGMLADSRKKRRNHNKGFSLVELIIVIAIMAILAAVIAPAVIRYIDKSRKAVDVATAEVIFKAAELAYTSGNDDAYAGWSVAVEQWKSSNRDTGNAHTWVTTEGHRCKDVKPSYHYPNTKKGDYDICAVAWCRGILVKKTQKEYENTYFKSALDDDVAGSDIGRLQRAYTNEFLNCLLHEKAKDGTLSNRSTYDGDNPNFLAFRYKKDAGWGSPECWILCIRCDTLTPEVWIGDKRENVTPLYRLYPDPCQEYKE